MSLSIIPLLLAVAAPEASIDEEPSWRLSGAVRSRPEGGFIGGEALFSLAPDLSLGAYLNYMYYWAEMGAKLEWRYLGGLIITGVWAGLEPGEFIPAGVEDETRRPGLRALLRGRAELNLRGDRWWLYNRLSVVGRLRTFEEHDPFREARLGAELSVEEAVAPLVAIARFGERSALWAYVELTVETELSFGLLDLRPSAGLIWEEAFDGVTFNLDVFRSLRDAPRLEGFGALFFMWWRLS